MYEDRKRFTSENEELVTLEGERGVFVVRFFGPHDTGKVFKLLEDGVRIEMHYSVAYAAVRKALEQRDAKSVA